MTKLPLSNSILKNGCFHGLLIIWIFPILCCCQEFNNIYRYYFTNLMQRILHFLRPKFSLLVGLALLASAWYLQTFTIESHTKHIVYLKERQNEFLRLALDNRIFGLAEDVKDVNQDGISNKDSSINKSCDLMFDRSMNLIMIDDVANTLKYGIDKDSIVRTVFYVDSLTMDSVYRHSTYEDFKKFYVKCETGIGLKVEEAQSKATHTIIRLKDERLSATIFSIIFFAFGTFLIAIDNGLDFIRQHIDPTATVQDRNLFQRAILAIRLRWMIILGYFVLVGAWSIQTVVLPEYDEQITYLKDRQNEYPFHLLENHLLDVWQDVNDIRNHRIDHRDSLMPNNRLLYFIKAMNLLNIKGDSYNLTHGMDSNKIGDSIYGMDLLQCKTYFLHFSYSDFMEWYYNLNNPVAAAMNADQITADKTITDLKNSKSCFNKFSIWLIIIGTVIIYFAKSIYSWQEHGRAEWQSLQS
jgi:hypothetical protein